MNVPLVTKQDINIEDVRSNLGTVYFKMGKYTEAKQIFNGILTENPQNEIALDMLNKIKQIQENK